MDFVEFFQDGIIAVAGEDGLRVQRVRAQGQDEVGKKSR